jgi:hypothetical protein
MFPPPPPWKALAEIEPDREYLAFTSRFFMRSARRVPPFLLTSLGIRREANRAAGIIGWSLSADLPKLEFYTLSVWTDRESLHRFMRDGHHGEAMRRFAKDTRRPSLFAYYPILGRELPVTWADAIKRQEAASVS